MIKKEFQGKLGNNYDLATGITPHYSKVQKSLVREIGKFCLKSKKKTIRVLEIGSGTGLTTELILKADSRIIVVGIDISSAMMDQCKIKLKKYIANSRLTLFLQDASNFTKNTREEFDIVASAYTIHNLQNPEKKTLIPSIYRALTPKGLFVNADIISQDNELEHKKELNFMLDRAIYFDEIKKPELKQEWINHYVLDSTKERKITESEYIILLQNAGFKDIIKTYREHMEATFIASKH